MIFFGLAQTRFFYLFQIVICPVFSLGNDLDVITLLMISKGNLCTSYSAAIS